MRLIALVALVSLTAMASADPPCRVVQRQQVVANSIHAATIYADTHLHLVEVPVPAFVFQTLTAYQPQVQIQQVATDPDGIGTDDQLAALLGMSQPQQLAISPVAEIAQKCGSCHSSGTAKGGLTLLDESGAYRPSTTKNNALTRSMIAARARSAGDDAMPPGVNTNPGKRLSGEAIQSLEH